ncbi:hypothetical protein OBV_41360 [Oscillibacter valericigenes Sjm18-20]|nr:hypothetical protein OBV_41360 [Oscillibacter valericigenes Sjm18-20]
MKESFKKHWKGITATVVAFGVVCSSIYYVNCVYLPGKQQAKAATLPVTEPDTSKDYHFTVNTDNTQAADSSAGSSSSGSTNPANDRIKITTDKDGTVTIDRTWDAKPGELDTTTTAPNAPTANIGSGGGKITGTDGAYHGEQAATTPSTNEKTTTPSTGSSDTTTKPSDSSTKPSTPSTPSTPSKPSSSTPQNGDTRVVDGQKQVYDDVFGWIADSSGGASDSIDMPDELSGIQVGEMG